MNIQLSASRGFMMARRSSAIWREWASHLIRTGAPAICAYLGRKKTVIEVDLAGTGRELTVEGLLCLWDLFEAEGKPLYARANSTLGFVRVPTEAAEFVASEVVKVIEMHTRPVNCRDSVEDAAEEIEKQSDTAYLESRGWKVTGDSARKPGRRARSLRSAAAWQLEQDARTFIDLEMP